MASGARLQSQRFRWLACGLAVSPCDEAVEPGDDDTADDWRDAIDEELLPAEVLDRALNPVHQVRAKAERRVHCGAGDGADDEDRRGERDADYPRGPAIRQVQTWVGCRR